VEFRLSAAPRKRTCAGLAYGPLAVASALVEVLGRCLPNAVQWMHRRPWERRRATMEDLDECISDAEHTNGYAAPRASMEFKEISRIK
jgi:hypothetical protein